MTGVGATSLTASQPDGAYKSETAWNDQYGSSGGGYSKLFARPSYQNGFVPSSGRGVPDVSYSGDVNNGLLIAWSQGDPGQRRQHLRVRRHQRRRPRSGPRSSRSPTRPPTAGSAS